MLACHTESHFPINITIIVEAISHYLTLSDPLNYLLASQET